jgi:hypothetical protein
MSRTLWSIEKGEKGGRTEVVELFGNQSREGKTIFPVRVLLLMHLVSHAFPLPVVLLLPAHVSLAFAFPFTDHVLRSRTRSRSCDEEDQACHRRHRDGQAAGEEGGIEG